MKELTRDQVRTVYNETLGDGFVSAHWFYMTSQYCAKLVEFANAILAKYGSAADERAIIERERIAFRRGFSEGQTHPVAYWYSFLEAAYPLPKADPEPPPVLTDHDINQLWDGNIIPRGYFDLTRKIERAVLAKLAEQKP